MRITYLNPGPVLGGMKILLDADRIEKLMKKGVSKINEIKMLQMYQ